MMGVEGHGEPGERGTYEEEPGKGGAEEDFEVAWLFKVRVYIWPGSRWDGEFVAGCLEHSGLFDGIDVSFGATGHVGLDVCVGLFDVLGDVKGIAWCFGDGDAVVEGETCRKGSESDNDTPGSVRGDLAGGVAGAYAFSRDEGLFKGGRDD